MLEILTITGPIFIIIAVGFTAVRLAFFAKSDIRTLGLFVINFAMPALIFKALSQRSFAEIMNANYLLAYALGSLAIMSVGVSIAYFGQKKDLPASTIHGMGMSFSNSGFIGYPIALQLLGPPASVALALNLIVENMVMLPLALALAESGTNQGERWRSVLLKSFARLLKNPIILSILVGWVLTFQGIPDQVVEAIKAVSHSEWFFLLLLNALVIFLGMFLESLAVMIVIIPIVLPAALSFGIDPIHLGVIIGLSTLIGLVTPPVGPGLYIVMVQTGIRMGELFRATIPFLIAMLASIVVVNAVPALSTWLPRIFGFG